MRSVSVPGLLLAALLCTLTIGATTTSYDMPNRHELKRADLSGAPGMEVIASISEYQIGESIPRHVHHGTETGYVLQGSTIQMPGPRACLKPRGAAPSSCGYSRILPPLP
jgi:hypothetical protein